MRSLQNHIGMLARVQWLVAAGVVLGLAAWYFVGYRPVMRKLETLRLQMGSRQRELTQNQNRARDLPILAAEVRQLERRVQTYDRQFPRQPDLGPFIKDLTRISQQLQLREWKYQPGAPKRGDSFYELPIQMHFQGEFSGIESFLRQVEDMQRLTRVRRMQIKSRDSRSGAVEVEMAMNIYFSEG